MELDIRWQQRFTNFNKALLKLSQAIQFIQLNFSEKSVINNFVLDEMIKEGLIQRFEYTHELAWKVMKDYAYYQGINTIGGSRDAIREAFQMQLIVEATIWMDMINSRNQSSHTYDEQTADEIYTKIVKDYFPAFLNFQKVMEDKLDNPQMKIEK